MRLSPYHLFPVAHWSTKVTAFIVALGLCWWLAIPFWIAVLVAWSLSILAAVTAGSIVLNRCPKALYVNEAEIDGMGYVHSNIQWIVGWTIFIVFCLICGFLAASTKGISEQPRGSQTERQESAGMSYGELRAGVLLEARQSLCVRPVMKEAPYGGIA